MPSYPPKDIEREAGNPDGVDAKGAQPLGALVAAVEPGSPADDAGFVPGCRITHVDGQPLRDLIDWRWLACEGEVLLAYVDAQGDEGEVELEREWGEDWGLAFDGVVFDRVRQCRNACTFCFMRQLPPGLRPSLSLRDDDFRLSFLAGTFVTLTNLTALDEQRILEQRLSPLRVSLHAVTPEVRSRLIGRHAEDGLAALERLLTGGIEVDAQVVLVPGANDGDELRRTLEWAYGHPGIRSVGIVPLGYTRHQAAFDRSFNDTAEARAVLRALEPFQERALAERGTPWAFAADELYRNAYGDALLEHLPPASHYGGFEMFEDGIGIIRSFVDELACAMEDGTAARTVEALAQRHLRVRYVVGGAMQPFLDQLIAESPLAGAFEALTVENRFFGGNVDVTGLLTAQDVARAIRDAEGQRIVAAAAQEPACPQGAMASDSSALRTLYALPSIMFNDDGLTLDDGTALAIGRDAGAPVAVVPCNPLGFLSAIAALAADEALAGSDGGSTLT